MKQLLIAIIFLMFSLSASAESSKVICELSGEYSITFKDLKKTYLSEGIEFFTPDSFSQQLGYMKREKNYVIPPHKHNKVARNVDFTQEVLLIRKGKEPPE